jgi:uncharacterized membrane-anchored protein YhcB (DUF1043 family)
MTKKKAITLIILGSILLIVGLIVSLKSIKPMYLNVIAGLIIIIGSFFGLFGKQLQDKSSSDKSDKILKTGTSTEEKVDYLKVQNAELTKQSELLKDKVEQQAKVIDNLMQENTGLYKKLAETALELNNNVIGESDLDIQINTLKNNEFNFRFQNASDLPVNNAHITIQNYTEIKKCEILRETEDEVHIRFDCYQPNYIKQSGININPNGAINFNTKSFNFLSDYMNFAIQIETRKTTLIYHLVYKIVNDKLVRSYRKYNLVGKKKIFLLEDNSLKLKDTFWKQNFYTKILYSD